MKGKDAARIAGSMYTIYNASEAQSQDLNKARHMVISLKSQTQEKEEDEELKVTTGYMEFQASLGYFRPSLKNKQIN